VKPAVVRGVVLVVFVGGIAGMIVGSIADNNGAAITFGLVTAVAALCLVLTTAITAGRPRLHFDEATASSMERRIEAIVASGANEQAVRDLVREAVSLGSDATEDAR